MKNFLSRSFLKDVVTLLSGTTFAQLLNILLSPTLTRIYGPIDFGEYALYASVVSLLGAGATLRYGQSIFMIKEEVDSKRLVMICFAVTSLLSLMTVIGVCLYLVVVNPTAEWTSFLAVGIFSTGVIEALTFWLSRNRSFRSIAVSRVAVSIGTLGLQIGLGVCLSASGLSLISSQALAQGTVAIGLIAFARRKFQLEYRLPMSKEIWRLLHEFRHFPIFTLPTDLLSTFVSQIPVFFLTHYLTTEVVGQYSLTMRVLGVPLVFLASAIGEVFRTRATAAFHETGECRRVFRQSLWVLLSLSLVFFSLLYFWGPFLIAKVFGSQWLEAGHYAQILCLMFFWRFISSPLSFMFYLVRRQREDFIVQIFNGLLTPLALFIGFAIDPSPQSCLWAFSIATAIVQIYYLVRSYQFSGGSGLRA